MIKALYSVSHLVDWVEVAKLFRLNDSVEPVFWTTTANNASLIADEFPNCVRISYLDIIAGRDASGKDFFSAVPIDEEVISSYYNVLYQAIQMMDRLDPLHSFSFNERHRFAIKMLTFALNVVAKTKPEIAFFNETPHHAPQFILYSVLKQKGIDCIMFRPFFLDSTRYQVLLDIYEDSLKSFDDTKEIQIDNQTELIIEKYRKESYNEIVPSYIKDQRSDYSIFSIFKLLGRKLISSRQFFLKKFNTSYEKLFFQSIYESESIPFWHLIHKVIGQFYKVKLKRKYNNFVKKTNAVIDGQYIVVALHYQPERSTSPEGGVYVDQLLMVQLLAAELGSQTKIYIKEHSTQFHYKMAGNMSRTQDYYERLHELGNVHFIPIKKDLIDYIDNSLAVATVTGIVGIESIYRGKKSLIFGKACWFKSISGAFLVTKAEDITIALQQEYSFEKNRDKHYRALQYILNNTVKLRILPTSKKQIVPDNENAYKIYKALRDKLMDNNIIGTTDLSFK